MMFPSLLCLLIGTAVAVPFDEFRSNFEFMDRTTNLDEPAYRLLDRVQPTDLRVDLDVYLGESRFTGVVTLTVDVSFFNSFYLKLIGGFNIKC